MAKHNLAKVFSTENRLFDDLDTYREFCADYGYKFDEATLGDMRAFAYQQYSKYMTGKNFKDRWFEDSRKFSV